MATLELVTERNRKAIGDYARTQESYANLSRKMSEQTKELREELGELLLPMAIELTQALITMISKFRQLPDSIKSTTVIVIGLVAVLAPLVIIVGALVTALGAISATAAAVVAAIASIAYVIGYVYFEWDNLVNAFETQIWIIQTVWERFKASIMDGINVVKDFFMMSESSVTVGGEIVVKDKAGAVQNSSLSVSGASGASNLGMNMAM